MTRYRVAPVSDPGDFWAAGYANWFNSEDEAREAIASLASVGLGTEEEWTVVPVEVSE